MTNIHLTVSERIKEKLLGFLSDFDEKDLTYVIEESGQVAEVRADYLRMKKGDEKTLNLEQLDKLLNQVIDSYET